MRALQILLLLVLGTHLTLAQERPAPPSKDSLKIKMRDSVMAARDSLINKSRKKEDEKTLLTIKDYKIISIDRDTSFVDTSQSIQKDYKYNYLRRDHFELMPFSNVGQAYNRLSHNFEQYLPYPQLGATARQFAYYEVDRINYYNVPTPLTELMFKTTFEQGQFLDALLAVNTSRRFNFSLAYTGMRSVGKYQDDQAELGRFRTTFNYVTANNRYWIRGHYAYQDLENQENGGILESSQAAQFESGDPEFQDRSRIDVTYQNTDSRVVGRRYFLDHQYNIVRPKKDSLETRSTLLSVGHRLMYETRFFQFLQDSQADSFGEAFDTPINDKARLQSFYNEASANFSNPTWGTLSGRLSHYHYNYRLESILIQDDGSVIPNTMEGEEILLGGFYENRIGGLHLKGDVQYALSSELTGNQYDFYAGYQLGENLSLYGRLKATSRMPNFNILLYQSEYSNFNWDNRAAFDKQQRRAIEAGLNAGKWGSAKVEFNTIENYTYFELDPEIPLQEVVDGNINAFVSPQQEEGTVNYFKVEYQNELKWRRWSLDNRILYQEVGQENQVFNVPQLVTRNSLYYSKWVFDKAMFLQTGVTLKYFTKYNMDGYHPLLGELYTQNREELGGFPMLDFFINARVRQTRIFLKAEHFNSGFGENNFYSAPNYPYRDFVIRFGLVWNFFS